MKMYKNNKNESFELETQVETLSTIQTKQLLSEKEIKGNLFLKPPLS